MITTQVTATSRGRRTIAEFEVDSLTQIRTLHRNVFKIGRVVHSKIEMLSACRPVWGGTVGCGSTPALLYARDLATRQLRSVIRPLKVETLSPTNQDSPARFSQLNVFSLFFPLLSLSLPLPVSLSPARSFSRLFGSSLFALSHFRRLTLLPFPFLSSSLTFSL